VLIELGDKLPKLVYGDKLRLVEEDENPEDFHALRDAAPSAFDTARSLND